MARSKLFINGVVHKKCSPSKGCGKILPLTDFNKEGNSLRYLCKECARKKRLNQENKTNSYRPVTKKDFWNINDTGIYC